jgi:hypothetical protein
MNTYKNPTWWNKDNDSSWERVKAAVKRDWDQTKHDMGANQPDTKQNANDTVKQAAGKESIPPRGAQVYEKAEPAFRFGYGARSNYGKKYPAWNKDLETQLRTDWTSSNPDAKGSWDENAEYVRSGWNYQK